MLILGIILIVGGFVVRHLINRRAFYRRNEAGVEEFTSYTSATLTHFMEKVGYILSSLMLVSGILLIVVNSMLSS